MSIKFKYIISFWLSLFCASATLFAQNMQGRASIDDQKRLVGPNDKKALETGRSFIRMDSTYYVGWLYTGIFKYEHSADLQGYQQAIPDLEKAVDLLSNDFGTGLAQLFNSQAIFSQYAIVFQDFASICNALSECYNNTDQPNKSMALYDFIDRFDFHKDFLQVDTRRAWLYHRYRAQTANDFAFLYNSISENEAAAVNYCQKALDKITTNKLQNDAWFGPTQSIGDQLSVYHYLALLKTYSKEYTEAEQYYQQLAKAEYVSWNNYGGLKSEEGDFKTALAYFEKDLSVNHEKMLEEPILYIPQLYLYAGRSLDAIRLAQSAIQENGSMPGFGWYNISLARAYLYNGQLDSATAALQKAKNFKEVHIGTTLTQQQYDFTIQILDLQRISRKIALLKFEHKNWWYSPKYLWQWIRLKCSKWMAEYVAVTSLSNNPDRERMFYDLFCSESTYTYDDIWYVLRDFKPKLFINKYSHYAATEQRDAIQKYYRLFTARFQWLNGDKQAARQTIESLLQNVNTNESAEKLYNARLYEIAIQIYEDFDNPKNALFYKKALLKTYPQLLPFLQVNQEFNLKIGGISDKYTEKIIAKLQDSPIQWNQNPTAPTINIVFSKSGDNYIANTSIVVDGQTTLQKNLSFDADPSKNQTLLEGIFQQ